ncbi:MAG: hypothetical protein B7Z15_22990, partial [Rhizobiales bacterium 32-66-8]
RRVPDRFGSVRARLTLNFAGHKPAPTTTPTQDDGMSPCSWTAWLAELDRQQLALQVDMDADNFELVGRRQANLNNGLDAGSA